MKRLLASVALLFALTLIVGCGDPHAVNLNGNQTRVVNALVGSSTINVNSSHGKASVSGLGFGQPSAYITGPFGNTNVTATDQLTGGTLAGPTQVQQVTNGSNTLVIAGIEGVTSGLQAPRVIMINDYLSPIPTLPTNTVALRLVNLSPDAGPLSLYGNQGTTPGQIGVSNVAYGTASTYASVPVGTGCAINLALYDQTGTTPVLVSSNLNTQGYDLISNASFSVYVFGMRNPAAGQPGLTTVLTSDPAFTQNLSTATDDN